MAKTVGVSVRRDGRSVPAEAALSGPEGWSIAPAGGMLGQQRFTLRAESVADNSTVTASVTVDGRQLSAQYLMLGPGAAPGFPCGVNVERCPHCHARIESCICRR
jgi:hypothetical protein